jgi:hypothetical protein
MNSRLSGKFQDRLRNFWGEVDLIFPGKIKIKILCLCKINAELIKKILKIAF